MSEQDNTPPADKPKRKRGNANSVGRPFQKGDARINRKGRPKTFDTLRREAVKIACETLKGADGNEMSVAHAILRSWAVSGDPQAQKLFIEYAYGKVPQKEEQTTINVDVSTLTDEQLERIAKGEDVTKVIASSGRSRA